MEFTQWYNRVRELVEEAEGKTLKFFESHFPKAHFERLHIQGHTPEQAIDVFKQPVTNEHGHDEEI